MKANHLQRSGDIMSVSANRAWIGGPITDSGDPTQLGRGITPEADPPVSAPHTGADYGK